MNNFMNTCEIISFIFVGIISCGTCTYCTYNNYCKNQGEYSEIIPINLTPPVVTKMER